MFARQSNDNIQTSIVKSVNYWNKNNIGLLTGQSGIFLLSHIWQVSLVLNGYDIHTIDCAMRFNAFSLVNEALRNDIHPESILNKIMVRRAFTPYQILDAIYSTMIQFRPGANDVYFLLAPCKQFFDGDVSFDEGLFLLHKLTSYFKIIRQKSIPLIVVEKQSYPNPIFNSIFPKICQLASPVWNLKLVEKEFESRYAMRISKIDRKQNNVIK